MRQLHKPGCCSSCTGNWTILTVTAPAVSSLRMLTVSRNLVRGLMNPCKGAPRMGTILLTDSSAPRSSTVRRHVTAPSKQLVQAQAGRGADCQSAVQVHPHYAISLSALWGCPTDFGQLINGGAAINDSAAHCTLAVAQQPS